MILLTLGVIAFFYWLDTRSEDELKEMGVKL